MCISERLKQVLDIKGMSVKEFSDVTGLSYRSAMNYLNEGRDPSVEALIKIHKALGVSITWLLTGTGEVFGQKIEEESNISSQEKELLSYYRVMPKSLQEAVKLSFKEIHKATNNFS